jgi:hypothetical protein
MVVMLWIVVFVVKDTFCTIPTVESYGAGVFCSRQNLIAVKLLVEYRINLTEGTFTLL